MGGIIMKKRILSLLILAGLVLTVFVGCSKEPATEVVEAEPVDVKKVFVSPQWVMSVITGGQEESNKYLIIEASKERLKDSSYAKEGHIPGALYLNIKDIEDPIYWTLKSPEKMEETLLELGITKDTVVILYGSDVSGVARVATGLIWAGVDKVKVLDGGLEAWTKAGYELETTANNPSPATDFGAEVPARPELILPIEDVRNKLAEEDTNFRLVSIRSYEEFTGETSGYSFIAKAGEPKGAVWGKAGSEYVKEDGSLISLDEMKELWADLDFTIDDEISFYSGRSWNASIPFLIMYENGYTNMTIYDGGWYRWQLNNEFEVQVGDPASGDVTYTTVKELPNDKAAK